MCSDKDDQLVIQLGWARPATHKRNDEHRLQILRYRSIERFCRSHFGVVSPTIASMDLALGGKQGHFCLLFSRIGLPQMVVSKSQRAYG